MRARETPRLTYPEENFVFGGRFENDESPFLHRSSLSKLSTIAVRVTKTKGGEVEILGQE